MASLGDGAATAPFPSTQALSLDRQLDTLTSAAVRLVVFDFDLCVLRIHSFGAKVDPATVASRAAGGTLSDDFVDLPFFLSVCRGLAQRGVPLAVASFGRYEVIQAYLAHAFGEGLCPFSRDNISTPSTVGSTDGCTVPGGKNLQLEALCARFGVEPRAVLFLDGALGGGRAPMRPFFSRRALHATCAPQTTPTTLRLRGRAASRAPCTPPRA